MKKKLPKNINSYECEYPEDDWMAHFSAFLDSQEHIVTKGGKAFLVKGKKKTKIRMVDN